MDREYKKYDTNFTESEILLAVIAEDIDHARQLISTMLPGEKWSLRHAVHALSDLINTSILIDEARTESCGKWRARKVVADNPCTEPVGYIMRRSFPVPVCTLCRPELPAIVEVFTFPEVKV